MSRMRFIVTIFSSVFAASAYADSVEDCKLYDTTGRGAMEIRQKGIPLAEALEKIKDMGESSDVNTLKAYAAMKFSLIEAYKKPRFSTESMKEGAISDFRNDLYSACLSSASERR